MGGQETLLLAALHPKLLAGAAARLGNRHDSPVPRLSPTSGRQVCRLRPRRDRRHARSRPDRVCRPQPDHVRPPTRLRRRTARPVVEHPRPDRANQNGESGGSTGDQTYQPGRPSPSSSARGATAARCTRSRGCHSHSSTQDRRARRTTREDGQTLRCPRAGDDLVRMRRRLRSTSVRRKRPADSPKMRSTSATHGPAGDEITGAWTLGGRRSSYSSPQPTTKTADQQEP